VSVTNANDNAPVITSNGGGAAAAVVVVEGSTGVTTVRATDADGLGAMTYAIVGGADRGRFTIDATSGVLAFVAAPDFESPADSGKNNVYDVEVRASDGTLSDVQSIAVTVANRNEAPVITSNGGASQASITIKENLTEVAKIAGFDPDAGAKLTFSIKGGADAAQFKIDSATGALAFLNAANFERPTDANFDNRYEVTVAVGDGALAAEQSLLVTVEDVGGKTVKGSKYRDTLKAKQSGESLVRGGGDHDVLLGTEEDDHLEGGKGNDKLYGGNGWDVLDGGVGKDLLVGGPHGDSFRFSSKLGKGNVDKVKFFSPYYDRIELDADVFKGLTPGLLDRAALHYGKQAADADDRIIYDQPTGNLFFDADGSGEARKVKFAVLVNKPEKLHEGDFLVI
jgi:Ca2+-binding RTX toxin-like protein